MPKGGRPYHSTVGPWAGMSYGEVLNAQREYDKLAELERQNELIEEQNKLIAQQNSKVQQNSYYEEDDWEYDEDLELTKLLKLNEAERRLIIKLRERKTNIETALQVEEAFNNILQEYNEELLKDNK